MKTNEELQKDVMAEFKWDSILGNAAAQIGVAATNGVVTLSGQVDSYAKSQAAERAALRVHGVKVVACEIVVNLGTIGKKTDTDIAQAIKSALEWNTLVNQDKIKVQVDSGWVKLHGEVEFAYQRAAVEDSVKNLLGVLGVTNNISLSPGRADSGEIKSKISAAFHRSATVDASSIRVDIQGGHLILSGTVKSWVEKEEAERIAWSSPGIATVENKIQIEAEILA